MVNKNVEILDKSYINPKW